MLATGAETGGGGADCAVRPALRYHGGKWRLAPWIVSHFPEHRTYVELFGGAAGVLLRKPRSYAEVYNDLDDDIANFFRVLRDPALCRALVRAVALTPFARDEFNGAWLPTEDPVERARRTAVRAQMGFGSAGATKGSTGFRIDSKRTSATAQHLWAEYPNAIAAAGRRLSGVLIENRPALEVMRQHDNADTLHFVDPPYLHQTRTLRGRGYRHEMDDAEHIRLLEALLELKGMVVLCGYGSALYDEVLRGWETRRTRARISAARGSALRTEVLWLNPACEAALEGEGLPLFSGVVS